MMVHLHSHYLVPIGVNFNDPDVVNDLEAETIALSYVRRQVERSGLTTIFLLDACRDNPFGDSLANSLSTQVGKSIRKRKGLIVASVVQGTETFIAFAARDGEVALAPTNGAGSYFTQALEEHLPKADSIQNNLSNVRGTVLNSPITNNVLSLLENSTAHYTLAVYLLQLEFLKLSFLG